MGRKGGGVDERIMVIWKFGNYPSRRESFKTISIPPSTLDELNTLFHVLMMNKVTLKS